MTELDPLQDADDDCHAAPDAGRPIALDAARKRDICLLIRSGCSIRRAASYVGVDESTIRKAARRDETFAHDLAQASVALEIGLVTKIRQSADRSWRAAAWLLEKKLPGEYGKETPSQTDRSASLTPDLDALKMQIATMYDEDLAELAGSRAGQPPQ